MGDSKAVDKIESITKTSGFVYSGGGPGYRVLVRKARKSSQAYYRVYLEDQPVTQLVKSTAGVMQEYTQSGGVRPFGISLLVAGLDYERIPVRLRLNYTKLIRLVHTLDGRPRLSAKIM